MDGRRGSLRPSTLGQVALLAAAVAFALVAQWVRIEAGWSVQWVVSDLVPGLAFLVVGVVAWRRRPGNRIGPLLFATGLSWFVGTYGATIEPTVGRLAYAFQGYYDAFLAWLVLAYPSGRLTSRGARIAVGLFFTTLGVRTIARLATFQVPGSYDLANPAEVDRYIGDTRLRENLDLGFAILITGIAILVLALIVHRWRATSGAGRRVVVPILIGGLAVAGGIVAELLTGFVRPASFEARILLVDLGDYITSATGLLVPLGFLYGIARTRRARSGVADLVVQLGDPGRAPPLREVLARALRDPSLVLAYPVPGSDGFVDAEGRPVIMPARDGMDRAVTRIESNGETIAALVHDAALAEEQALVTSVAAAARMALDNERLQAEVRAQLEEVRASRARIVSAGDEQRRRIERDLHDGAQQRLVTLALALQLARGQAGAAGTELASLLERACQELESALGELRELARGVHPSLLAEAGLGAAIEALAERAPVPVEVSVSLPPGRPRPEVEATAYFIVSESLANMAKHAAASRATVVLTGDERTLEVEIRDDGVGGADPRQGSGLVGLADRVAAIGGRLDVSSPPGGGTSIRAVLPCA